MTGEADDATCTPEETDVRAAAAAAARMPRTVAACDRALLYDRVDSTNVVARRILERMVASSGDGLVLSSDREPVPMTVVGADGQTRGHGRLGRVWSSGAGSFMISFAAVMPRRPLVDPTVNGWLPLAAGLSTIEALEDSLKDHGAAPTHPGCSLALKWPNDVFCDGLKLGGILVELVLPEPADSVRDDAVVARLREKTDRAGIVIGVGLNLDVDRGTLPDTATSLQWHRADLPPFDDLRDAVASRLASRLGIWLPVFAAAPERTSARLRERAAEACWTLGRRVVVRPVAGDSVVGTAEGLNADASLMVRDERGIGHVIRTGDVGILAG
ncbi:biotin--[acetyl-CoA-carboxylase] ligase [uncultured Bifidobacterium sp.]|uniref:biotin--[acetyl-CoA-carboxylase] ligase n=1 Tax=uncultured Bifidobacterium sp. TaxID=165187 RepID=UPI0028DD0462|nr:biotin--[acetyl-CoA-carboxylase] ligase [uncultured Bifidobacterium sp.]